MGCQVANILPWGKNLMIRKITQMKRNVRERFITYEHFYLAEPTDSLGHFNNAKHIFQFAKIGC